MKPRVFAFERCEQDVSAAAKFGEVVYLFDADGSRPSIWSDEFGEQVVKTLMNWRFNPDEDFILCTGKMVPLMMLSLTALAEFEVINLLLYNSVEREYVRRTYALPLEDAA